jgi:inward rectifier potassium channel
MGDAEDDPDGRELEDPAEAAPWMNSLRSIVRDRDKAVLVLGRDHLGWSDLYHRILTMPLWGLLLLLAAVYLTTNVLFAVLYLLQRDSIAGARPGSFADAFFFSVQTLGTVGYGLLTPRGLYANLLVTAETFCNLVIVAVSTGLIFTRVSRPTARVMFTKVAVVTEYEGVPTLMFRAANQRGNQVLEAEVTLHLARQVTTAEGHSMRQFQDLAVTRARSPLFMLSWLVMHRLDETSPLYGANEDTLASMGGEIIVALSGLDETFAQRIHARHSYLPHEILWSKRFADILSTAPDGRRVVDYRVFHDVHDD